MENRSHAERFIGVIRTRGILSFFKQAWIHFWMLFAGTGPLGCFASWLATWCSPPHYERRRLSAMNPKGFLAPSSILHGKDVRLGPNIFLDDRTLIYQGQDGGPIEIGAQVSISRDTVIETFKGGRITIGATTVFQPHCFLSAAQGSIHIGAGVNVAAYCAFYPHDHGMLLGQPIRDQALVVKGDIFVEEGAWLGHGVTVLSGVRIGKGAVIGAGSTVANDVPENAVAWGVPAKVFMKRKGHAKAAPEQEIAQSVEKQP